MLDLHGDTVAERAEDYANQLGHEHGATAASWVDDPEIFDGLTTPDLSGQWADMITGPQLVEEALAAAGSCAPADVAGRDQLAFTEICDAYDLGFRQAVEEDIRNRRLIHYHYEQAEELTANIQVARDQLHDALHERTEHMRLLRNADQWTTTAIADAYQISRQHAEQIIHH